MKKKVLSLLLTLCLVMTFVPMAAFAAETNRISITTVAELLQFANAVDNGEYDDKTDAVVSLDADLDLTGVAWKPIGSVFDGDGNLLHYFSGKFYGNGHTISNSSITITADTATHTQTIAMTYLPADYTKVDEAIAKANALNKDNYKDFSAVETAVNAVVRDKNITDQSEVDAMANAIEDAIAALQYKDADYTKVDAALAKANALKKDDYKDFSAVETAVNAVARGKNITEQAEVDAMAKAIEDAIAALQYKDADYTRVDAAIARANALNKNDYKDFSGVECAIRAVARGKNITQQAEVDAMAKAIEDALAALQYKDANKTTQPTPAPAATATPQYTIPQTGDTSNPALLVVLMLVSGSAAIGTAVVASKRKNNR